MGKTLITGGAGFIGSNLCKSLINDNKEILCVDNFFSSNVKNIEKLKHQVDKFKLIKDYLNYL